MSKAPPVDQQPLIHLEKWLVVQIGPDATGAIVFSLVGIPAETETMRMTTFLKTFDPEARTAVTESGRTYRLVGDSSHEAPHPHAGVMITQWCAGQRIPLSVVNVVPLEAMADAVPPPAQPAAAWLN